MYPGYTYGWWLQVHIAVTHLYTVCISLTSCTLGTDIVVYSRYTFQFHIYILSVYLWHHVPRVHLLLVTQGTHCSYTSLHCLYTFDIMYPGYRYCCRLQVHIAVPHLYTVCISLTSWTPGTHIVDPSRYTLQLHIYILSVYHWHHKPLVQILLKAPGTHCSSTSIYCLYIFDIMYPGYTYCWWLQVHFAFPHLYTVCISLTSCTLGTLIIGDSR